MNLNPYVGKLLSDLYPYVIYIQLFSLGIIYIFKSVSNYLQI